MPKNRKSNSQTDVKPYDKTNTEKYKLNIIFRSAFRDMRHNSVIKIAFWITTNVIIILIGLLVIKSPTITIVLIALLWLLLFSHFVAKQINITFIKAYIYISDIVVVFFVIYLIFTWNFFYKTIFASNSCDSIVVYERFNCDFRNSLILSDTEHILINNESVKIDEQLHIDSTRYDFVCYHIPDTTTTMAVCKYLLENTPSIIDSLIIRYRIGLIRPFKEPPNLPDRNNRYPDAVYFYCEQSLSNSDKYMIRSFEGGDLKINVWDKNSFKK